MPRTRLLTVSSLLTFMTIAGTAHAGPTITNYNAWPNEAARSSWPAITPAEPDAYRARAMQRRTPPAATTPAGRQGCRFLGGAHGPIRC